MFTKLKNWYVKKLMNRAFRLSPEFQHFIQSNSVEFCHIFGNDFISSIEETPADKMTTKGLVAQLIDKPYTSYELSMWQLDPMTLFIKLAAEKTWTDMIDTFMPDMGFVSRAIFDRWAGFNSYWTKKIFVIKTDEGGDYCTEGYIFKGTVNDAIKLFEEKIIGDTADDEDSVPYRLTNTAEYIRMLANDHVIAGYDVFDDERYAVARFDSIRTKIDKSDEIIRSNSLNRSLLFLGRNYISPFQKRYREVINTMTLQIDGWKVDKTAFPEEALFNYNEILPITFVIIDKTDGCILEDQTNVRLFRQK